MGGFDLTMCQVIVLFPLQRRYLGISQQDALLGDQFLQGGQALFEGGQVVAQPDGAHAGRRNEDMVHCCPIRPLINGRYGRGVHVQRAP
ncbi:hypothetical protein SDC9_211743 [bioreactor metagenome]|uniref:Uncharacterized protein n=1 Tax=bioreactor metagenome TaxID=1076179 RepID=A0A645JWC7_9ZZZZ